jgi:hypothetical protein
LDSKGDLSKFSGCSENVMDVGTNKIKTPNYQ